MIYVIQTGDCVLVDCGIITVIKFERDGADEMLLLIL